MTDDQALASRVAAGNEQAFRLLIRQHERLVAHMVRRLIDSPEDLEELCQDVFLKVHEKIGEFNFQSRLSTWIATIAYRTAINHKRKRKLDIGDLPDEEQFANYFVAPESLEDDISDRDMEGHVMTLIDQLPQQYRIVLTLYHVDGMNYQEIGSVTGMPEGTVKNYLFRSRQLLKEKVKHYLGKEHVL